MVRRSEPDLGCSEHLQGQARAAGGGAAGAGQPARGDRRGAPARALPPRRALLRAGLLGASRRDGGGDHGGLRDRAGSGGRDRSGDPRLQPRLGDDLRRGAGEPSERDHPVPAAEPLCGREAGGARAGGRAARAPGPARQLGDPLQPRVRAPARAVRHAPDQPRGGGDLARPPGRAHARLARGRARLVVRRRRDGGRLADAPAGAGRRLRARQRCGPHGGRVRRAPRSPASASRPSAICASTSSSSGHPRARPASATRRRRASGWGGARGSTSPSWWRGWWPPTWSACAPERARAAGRPGLPERRRRRLHCLACEARRRHRPGLRGPATRRGLRPRGLRGDRPRRGLAQGRRAGAKGAPTSRTWPTRSCARSPSGCSRPPATPSSPRPTPC